MLPEKPTPTTPQVLDECKHFLDAEVHGAAEYFLRHPLLNSADDARSMSLVAMREVGAAVRQLPIDEKKQWATHLFTLLWRESAQRDFAREELNPGELQLCERLQKLPLLEGPQCEVFRDLDLWLWTWILYLDFSDPEFSTLIGELYRTKLWLPWVALSTEELVVGSGYPHDVRKGHDLLPLRLFQQVEHLAMVLEDFYFTQQRYNPFLLEIKGLDFHPSFRSLIAKIRNLTLPLDQLGPTIEQKIMDEFGELDESDPKIVFLLKFRETLVGLYRLVGRLEWIEHKELSPNFWAEWSKLDFRLHDLVARGDESLAQKDLALGVVKFALQPLGLVLGYAQEVGPLTKEDLREIWQELFAEKAKWQAQLSDLNQSIQAIPKLNFVMDEESMAEDLLEALRVFSTSSLSAYGNETRRLWRIKIAMLQKLPLAPRLQTLLLDLAFVWDASETVPAQLEDANRRLLQASPVAHRLFKKISGAQKPLE